jgi:hypothetical protein
MVQWLSQWRTALSVLTLGLMLLVGLWICCNVAGPVAIMVAAIFSSFSLAIVGLGGVLGSKSAVEHLAGGGGVKGAAAALMTDAKPQPQAEGLPK